ncbi:MAG: TfuA-like protein [Pseudomonadota bacterium]
MNEEKVVFVGPSVPCEEFEKFPDLQFLSPCKQGDVYLATLNNPVAIGIIDGYFEGAPSVWHKEILWALSRGISVLGASSMGALRASELDAFGMEGVGEIYKWYKTGQISDDDEVALLHGPEALKFPAISEPMVNIRATCQLALMQEVAPKPLVDDILSVAKSTFYKTRTWHQVLTDVEHRIPDRAQLRSFTNWLEHNKKDQKHLDAVELCERMSSLRPQDRELPKFQFEETEFWFQNTKLWQRQKPAKPDKRDGSKEYRLFEY